MKLLNFKSYICALLFLYARTVFAAPAEVANDNAVKPIDKFYASIGLGIENSNNIYLSPNNQKSDNILHQTFSASYRRNSPTVQTEFSLDADHEHYLDNSFSDQNIFSSLLAFNALLIKNRLSWNVSNRFDHVQTQTSALNLPTNKENTNSFTTGPTYTVFRDSRQYLNLVFNYNKLYTQKSEVDSSSYSASAVYNRELTRTFSMELNIAQNKRNFVNDVLNTDYRRTDAVVTLTKKLRLSEIYAATGQTKIVRKGNTNIDHGILRLGYKYQIPNFSSLVISYDRELGDFTGVFTNASALQGNELLPNIGSQIFLIEQGGLSLKRNFGSASVGYSFSYFGANYSNSLLDTTVKDSEISYLDSIGSTLELGLNGSYLVNTYRSSNRKDTTYVYAGILTKRISGVYSLSLKLQYSQRNSDVATFNYDERRISINGKYFF